MNLTNELFNLIHRREGYRHIGRQLSYKDRERTYRKLNQYNRSGWNPIELHATDRELHVKMKRKMRKRGIR